MQSIFIQIVLLILIILGLVMLASRLKIAYPIVLVIAGLLLSATGQFSDIAISPDLVFLIFLPPLLYEAAWQISWKEAWRWRRVITSFAFPVVILTSCVVALVSHAVIPGFTLALGFLLGGIVSPPDAVSATTIMQQVKVPRTLRSIIEGESLLNDASSLVVFRFALAAVLTGQFHFGQAAGTFALVVILGVAIGLGLALVFYAIQRWLPTTPGIETVLSLVIPYCMYYGAEHFHFSGVLAVVSGGLFLSQKRQTLMTYRSRLEGVNVWNNLVFVLNGLVFILIGLQLPAIAEGLDGVSLLRAIGYGLLVSGTLIVARLACALGTVPFTRLMSRIMRVGEANPGWKGPLVFGWAGMRGVVSLAAALSVPLLTSEGAAFPFRNLILFITFVVILVTLVFQGLTLPWLIRRVELGARTNDIPEPRQEQIIQKKLARNALQYLEEAHADSLQSNEYLRNLRRRMNTELRYFDEALDETKESDEASLNYFRAAYLELLERQRELLNRMNQKFEFDEEIIRKFLALTDMDELRIREKLSEESVTE